MTLFLLVLFGILSAALYRITESEIAGIVSVFVLMLMTLFLASFIF